MPISRVWTDFFLWLFAVLPRSSSQPNSLVCNTQQHFGKFCDMLVPKNASTLAATSKKVDSETTFLFRGHPLVKIARVILNRITAATILRARYVEPPAVCVISN